MDTFGLSVRLESLFVDPKNIKIFDVCLLAISRFCCFYVNIFVNLILQLGSATGSESHARFTCVHSSASKIRNHGKSL